MDTLGKLLFHSERQSSSLGVDLKEEEMGGITCERGARAGGLEASAERSPPLSSIIN